MFKYLVLLLLAGCAVIPRAPTPISTFDFGSLARPEYLRPVSSLIQIQFAGVTAPAWLDTQAMRYRLVYHHPAQTHVYANNRWAAPPASLLTERIKQHIASWQNSPDRRDKRARPATYILKIELEDFVQVFDAVNRSHVNVSLRASLFERDTRLLVAQQRFSEAQSTSSADASGAAKAFIAISDQLAAELIQWSVKVMGRPSALPE